MPETLPRLWQVDLYGRVRVEAVGTDDVQNLTDIILDVREAPDFIANPGTIRREIEKFDEIRRTLIETLKADAASLSRPESLLLLIHGKFITLLKCLIAVYNFFHVPNMMDPGERYSTLLDPDVCPDLPMMIMLMDATLMDERIDSPACSHVLRELNLTMKTIFDLLATIVDGDQVKSGIGKLRDAYRAFHIRHRGQPNDFEPSQRLLGAFAKVADFLSGLEGVWMRDRPEPTLRRPFFGLTLGRTLPNKVVGVEFERSENTIVNWNKGKGRPFEYNGPYPDTPEGEAALKQDAELFNLRKSNHAKAMALTKKEIAASYKAYIDGPHYTQTEYGLRVHGSGNKCGNHPL